MTSIQQKLCTVNGCDKKHEGLGYCHMHYARFKKHKDVGSVDSYMVRNGKRNHQLYFVWCSMRQRCYDNAHSSYLNYGARGITVCDRWLGKYGFDNFLSDMGERPSNEHSIDRIDVNGNYEPSNCRWATHSVQSINRRYTRTNSSGVKGVCWVKSKQAWCSRIGFEGATIHLGCFKSKTKAILVRKQAEHKYHQLDSLKSE